MFVLKLAIKLLLLPVLLLLGVIKLLVKISLKLSSIVLGAAILLVFGGILLLIVQQAWGQLIFLFLIEAGLVLLTFATGVVQAILDIVCTGLKTAMRS